MLGTAGFDDGASVSVTSHLRCGFEVYLAKCQHVWRVETLGLKSVVCPILTLCCCC